MFSRNGTDAWSPVRPFPLRVAAAAHQFLMYRLAKKVATPAFEKLREE